jgi:hypothetical protein
MQTGINIQTNNLELHKQKTEHHNCSTCHDHNHLEQTTPLVSLTKKIHENNGHTCNDSSCSITAPHGHNKLDEKNDAPAKVETKNIHRHNHEQKHSDTKSHDHGHKHEHKHEHQFPILPLEDFIAHAKIPKWLRETLLNISFLSPAMISSSLLEKLPLPKILKTWISISAMHGINRGKQKLPRLGLTYLISGAANIGSNTSLGKPLSRFLASTAVAFVEKFSNNGHHHKKESLEQMFKRETKTLFKNIQSKKQWKELLPSLLNIEAKVQVIAPLINYLTNQISTNKTLLLASKIIFTSLSFVGADKALIKLAKGIGGQDSSFAASISTVCGCCSSPVCSVAATDTALSDSI